MARDQSSPYVVDPDWEGPTFNSMPVVPRDSDLRVQCRRDRMRFSDEDCDWEGPVADLDHGKTKIGSQPNELACPECGLYIAAIAGTTSAGYWNGKLP